MENNLFSQQYANLGAQAVAALNKHLFKAQFVPTRAEALAAVLALVPPTATIGMGGSKTLEEVGICAALAGQGNVIFSHKGLPATEALAMRKKQITADVFLSSSNAVTLSGELINVDGTGNRVAALTFGPGRVIVVVGANKIVLDEAAGRERIRLLAAPINALRLGSATPCAKVGHCMNCASPQRLCNITHILHYPGRGMDFHVIIVGESLGF